jgi:hypothetical protein
MDSPDTPAANPPYEDTGRASFIYFDIASAHGIMNGAIQIELASRVLIPDPAGPVEIRFRTTGHLRCSPSAAVQLRDALSAALQMLEDAQQKPAAAVASKLN